jgi:hypothetical protein
MGACLAVTLLLVTAADGRAARDIQDASSGTPKATAAGRAPCCYTHPQYAGPCAVQPAKGETCASILSYLNDPRSQGKSYCNNTNIRGGWKQVKCARSS